jgi:signal transduction histidine kinase
LGETEASKSLELPRGILREVTPLSMWAGDTLIYRTIVGLAALALPVIAAVHWVMRGTLPWPQLAFTGCILAGGYACLAIAQRGAKEIAAAMLVGLLWLSTTIYAFKTGYGMHSAMVFIYLPCLLYTGLFFGIGIASAQLALTAAALVLMYYAETTGRIGGAAEVVATGTPFNYMVGIVVTLVGTLAGGLVYHRRVQRESARVVAEAAKHLSALESAQAARAELETARARLESFGAQVSARASARDRELDAAHHSLETLRAVLTSHSAAGSRDLAEIAACSLQALAPETLDLTALAQQAAERARAEPGLAKTAIRVDAGLQARGDRRLVAMLLERLILRACRACRGEPEAAVHVGGGSLGGRPVFHVRDNGPALGAAQRAALFEPSGAGAPDLTALVARCIVERHGGELELDAAPGNETTFFFSLPG